MSEPVYADETAHQAGSTRKPTVKVYEISPIVYASVVGKLGSTVKVFGGRQGSTIVMTNGGVSVTSLAAP